MVSFRACKPRLYPYSVPGTAALVNMTRNMRYKNDKNIKFVVTTFVFFKLKMHQNLYSAPEPNWSSLRSLRPPSRLWRGIPIPLPRLRRLELGAYVRRLGFQAPSTEIPGYASAHAPNISVNFHLTGFQTIV